MGLLGRAHPGVMLRFESRFHSTSSSNAAIWEPMQGPFWLNIVVFGVSFLYRSPQLRCDFHAGPLFVCDGVDAQNAYVLDRKLCFSIMASVHF